MNEEVKTPQSTASSTIEQGAALSSAYTTTSQSGGWYKLWSVIKKVWGWAAYSIGSLFLILLILVIITSLLVGSWGPNNAASESYLFGSGSDKVVVLPIEGVIGEAGSSVLGEGVGVSTETLRRELQQVEADPLAKAVILQVNSPGGSAVVSDEIYQIIMDFKRDAKKPVVASFGDTAASGGYYIASAADKIVANPATLTGSIGVIMEYFNASGLMEKIGVSPEVVKSGTFKDIGSVTRQTTPEERAILQGVVDEAYAQFVARVSEGRKMERAKVAQLADGRVYTGTQAKANGLVDELGSLNKAADVAKKLANINEASVVRYERGDWLSSLLGTTTNLQPLSKLNRLVPSNTTTGLQYRWMP